MALAEALVGHASPSRLRRHCQPGDLQPQARTESRGAVAIRARADRRHRLVRGAVDHGARQLRSDLSAGPAGHADHHAADLDCGLGRARSQHGAGVRICRADAQRGRQRLAAVRRGHLPRRCVRRTGLDLQRRKGGPGLGADRGSESNSAGIGSAMAMFAELLPSHRCASCSPQRLSAGITWAIQPLLQQLCARAAECAIVASHSDPAGRRHRGDRSHAAGRGRRRGTHGGRRIPPAIFAATLFIALVGFADDIKSIPVLPRLLLQAAAVGAVIFTAPGDVRIVAGLPALRSSAACLLLAGLWFVNLVNFMDGLDLMTVAEVVPITGAMILLGWLGDFPSRPAIVAAALCGAMLGFAPFNRPVAKVFLGDVGSLPIGLLLGWCLLHLAWQPALDRGAAAAALLSRRRDVDAVSPDRPARTVLGRASLAFLSAGDRQRLCGVARGRRGVRAQCRARGAGDHRRSGAARPRRRSLSAG